MRRSASAVAALLLMAGCTSAHKDTPAPAPTQHSAAEPASAAAPSVAPAGRMVPVGPGPEGIVYDTKAGVVAVAVRGPDRLLLLNDRTLAVVHSVPLPGHVRHLQVSYDGGSIIVPCEDANSLLVVNSTTGAITSTTKVGTSPHDATETQTGLFVAGDEFGESLSVVADGSVARTITQVQQPGSVIAVGGSSVAVVDVKAYTISTFDASTGQRTAILDAGAGPTHGVVVADQTVVVADTRGNQLLLFGTSPLRQLASMPLPGSPYGLAADRQTGTVWVTLTGLDEVAGFRVQGTTFTEVGRYPTAQQPNTVAVAPGSGSLYVTATAPGVVQLITR